MLTWIPIQPAGGIAYTSRLSFFFSPTPLQCTGRGAVTYVQRHLAFACTEARSWLRRRERPAGAERRARHDPTQGKTKGRGALLLLLPSYLLELRRRRRRSRQKSMMGSPMVRLRSTVHGRLKSFAVMNLKILFTLMLCVALEKKRVAFIALAYALACGQHRKGHTRQSVRNNTHNLFGRKFMQMQMRKRKEKSFD